MGKVYIQTIKTVVTIDKISCFDPYKEIVSFNVRIYICAQNKATIPFVHLRVQKETW